MSRIARMANFLSNLLFFKMNFLTIYFKFGQILSHYNSARVYICFEFLSHPSVKNPVSPTKWFIQVYPMKI